MKTALLFNIWTILAGLCMAIKNEELLKRSRKSSDRIIELTDSNFQKILGTGRDAWIMVFLTSSSPQIGCNTCLEAADEFKLISSSWFKDHPEGLSTAGEKDASLFFAMSDLKDKAIPDIFRFYGLEHVPRFFLFGPGGGINDYDIIDLLGSPGIDRTLNLANAVKQATEIPDLKLYQPMNWSVIIISAVVTFTTVYMFKRHYALTTRVLSMRPLWAVLWTSFIIMMLGGYMFNSIRGSQLAGVAENGDLIYFLAGQSQAQFKIETQVVGVIYGTLAAAIVCLTLAVPKVRNYYKDSRKTPFVETSISVILAIVIYAFFAGLTTIYEIKQPGYPYSLTRFSSFFNFT
ncbi:OST3 (YOR085W) [Zygosaccharomyces parabailii]|uniref:ZYBA0S04-08152g1_1 n=1 Tax=Zygosaccharomyces bailii (strain CLIB 213 / ATCC 58445 / CBS 680 / BCRC 21525 / NBRC 1098 / NCYC 1416 / NRRL Y-2227) TaxID=1333698 RepID=A0A8J2XAR3_ZYGB2|nr:OST3 (YOR085W) [Zygosaccharomyces parabailii]CDF89600.1 ZYBA0S04-08152g1_1 [Zygosaccharomyces bailii CLIB 213]CDH13718.1 related to Dolichyl-diphosphooligosaccharide--protein glycosyltransferase subunit 3 [Zygosaccharomyces bailii ISA1307]SJM87463.1 related to Dolichyl-diphosphooligosaccharide--protein glycosyltransferase subunit 3 [Zygosaccharomyces bailii]